MQMEEKEIREMLKTYNQEHLMLKYDTMSNENKQKLLNQLSSIDYAQILNLYQMTKSEIKFENDKIEPIPYIDKLKLSDEEKEHYEAIGKEAISNGKLGFITMAGGQGTRLGHKGPKGTFKLIGNKTLFELICETLKDGKNKYNARIPWYIMTSKENNDDTVKFFEYNNYF